MEFKHDPNAGEAVDPGQKKKSRTSWMVTPFLILAIYVLSIGPATRLNSDGYISNRLLNTIYAPFGLFCHGHPAISDPVMSYISLWQKKGPPSLP